MFKPHPAAEPSVDITPASIAAVMCVIAVLCAVAAVACARAYGWL